MDKEELTRLREQHGWQVSVTAHTIIRLLDEVDRLTKELEAERADCQEQSDNADLWCARFERAEAELAQSESTLAGLRRVHAETVERYQRAEADLADEKRRHAERLAGVWDHSGARTAPCSQMPQRES